MAKDHPSRIKRANTHKAKPYERPTTSLLKKVANTVCDLLPSWLNLSSWSVSKSSGIDDVTTRDSDSENEVEVTENEPEDIRSPDPFKEPLDAHLGGSDISSYTRCPLPRTTIDPNPTLVNGDDQSDNSESSASTSGCSSLAPSHQEKKRVLRGLPVTEEALVQLKNDLTSSLGKRKKDVSVLVDLPDPKGNETPSSRGSLWSEDEGLLLPKRQARPQPISTGKKASFRLSSFGAPVPRLDEHANSSVLMSPFYRGRTTFGGASSLNASGFSTMRKSAAKVIVRERTSPEYISSTARRILNTLERMTTPLSDVKKIPTEKNSVDFALSYTPMNYRRKADRNSDKTNQPTRLGPPARSLKRPYPTSLSTIPQPAGAEITDRTTDGAKIAPEDKGSDLRKATGKMTRQSKRTHYSAKVIEEEVLETPVLKAIPLPITTMPQISFDSFVTSTPAPTVVATAVENNPLPPPFSFASPIIQHQAPPISSSSIQQVSTFSFSKPVITALDQEEKTVEKDLDVVPLEINFVSGESVALAAKPVRLESRAEEKKDDNWSSGGLNPAKELIIGGSVLDILGCTAKSQPSGTSSSVENTAKGGITASSLGFDSRAGNWICSVCCISNPPASTKCMACENAKPSSGTKTDQPPTSLQFNPPTGDGECLGCVKASPAKCLYCAVLKPGSESAAIQPTTTASGFEGKFAPSPFLWECETCFVSNKTESSKCASCDTPRNTSQKITGVKETFTGFKFGSLSKTSSSPASFKFGMSEVGATANTFKFGVTSLEASASSPFGNSKPPVFGSVSSKPAPSPVKVKFAELPAESNQKNSDVVTSGKVEHETKSSISGLSNTFTFGIPAVLQPDGAAEKKPPSGFTAEKDSTAKTDSFAKPTATSGFTFKDAKPFPADAFGQTSALPAKETVSSVVETSPAPTLQTGSFASPLSSVVTTTAPSVSNVGFRLDAATTAKLAPTFRFGENPLARESEKPSFESKEEGAKVAVSKASEINVFGQAGSIPAVKFGDVSKPLGIVSHLSKTTTDTPSLTFGGFRIPTTSSMITSCASTTSNSGLNFLSGKTSVASVFAKPESTTKVGQATPFVFGATTSGPPATGFVFSPTGFAVGATQKPTIVPEVGGSLTTSAPSYSFGSGNATKFDFGTSAKNEPAAPPSGGFKFTVAATTASSALTTTTSTPTFGGFGMPAAPTSTGFPFGCSAVTPAPAFGSSNSTSIPLFGNQSTFGTFGSSSGSAFGISEAPAFGSTAPASNFQFAPSSTVPDSSSLFHFGAHQQPEQKIASSSPFFVGVHAPQVAPQPSNTGFNFSESSMAPSSFNFASAPGAQSQQAPFQFAAAGTLFNPGTSSTPRFGERKIRKATRRSVKK